MQSNAEQSPKPAQGLPGPTRRQGEAIARRTQTLDPKKSVAAPNFPAARADSTPERLVSAEQLRELLWDEKSKPSLRWIREQQTRGAIPSIKIGRRVWFYPSAVKRHLEQVHQLNVKRYQTPRASKYI